MESYYLTCTNYTILSVDKGWFILLQALPALKSFCVYAALGILFLFIMQSTFFVAWLTIDERRQNSFRDACCIWIKYYNYVPNTCSQRQFLPLILRKYVAPSLTTLPIKVSPRARLWWEVVSLDGFCFDVLLSCLQ